MTRFPWKVLLCLAVITTAGASPAPIGPAFPRTVDTAQNSQASELIITVDAPAEVPPGRLVKLDASATEATAFRWTLAGGAADLYDVTESGRVCYFATATPGKYVFVLAAARNSETAGDPPLMALGEVVVVVTGQAPTPGPLPPVPVLPDGRYKLAAYVYGLAATLPATDKPLLQGVASNYAAVASMAAAGVLADPAAMLNATKERNAATAGANRERLLPPLFQPLANRLAELSRAGDLKTLADHITAWQEISTGLSLAGGK
jgi:hypothetical protein